MKIVTKINPILKEMKRNQKTNQIKTLPIQKLMEKKKF